MPVHSFVVGQAYSRKKDIHAVYGGQSQGGISTPAAHPLIFLITGESGSTYGYSDRFTGEGAHWYEREGQVGLSVLVVYEKGGLQGRAVPGEAFLQVQLTW